MCHKKDLQTSNERQSGAGIPAGQNELTVYVQECRRWLDV